MMNRRDNRYGYTLSGFGIASSSIRSIRKTDVRTGDCVLVRTRNSVYMLQSSGDGVFTARGGWFSRKGKDGLRTAVNGCTLGGSIIKVDVIAACGLCIEFSNRLITTPVEGFAVLRMGWQN